MLDESTRVLLIEDDPIWSINVESMLEGTSYKMVGTANSFATTEAMINGLEPEIIISDIVINNNHIYDFLVEKNWAYNRYVFITSHADDFMYLGSKKFEKSIFLVKPFHKNTLLSSLDLLVTAFPIPKNNHGKFINFTGKLQKNKKVFLNEITHIYAMGNYSAVYTVDKKKYVKKNTLSKLRAELDERFVQVHKSHIVNLDYINRLNLGKDYLVVNNEDVPIGRVFRKNLDSYIEKEN